MIIGIGIDIVELNRIKEITDKQPRFPKRILTVSELSVYSTLSDWRKIEFLAGRFAAKEAYSKAVGTGIDKSLDFTDIEVLNNEQGKPNINISSSYHIHLSISHSKEYAVAQVIIEEI